MYEPVPIYGEVPPVPVTLIVVFPPLQAIVPAVFVADRIGGSVIVIEDVA